MGISQGSVQKEVVLAPVIEKPTAALPNLGDCKVLRALYDLASSSRNDDELSFRKNDLFKLINDENEDWWLVESLESGRKGYLPCNFVVLQDSMHEKLWFHGAISRKDCEKLLESKWNVLGTFLIRESESLKGTYSLSELCLLDDKRTCKHYHLRRMDSGRWYISPKSTFCSLDELIESYSNSGGLLNNLTVPCPKLKPVMRDLSRKMKDKWEIDRRCLRMTEKLGSGNFGDVWKGLWNETKIVAIKMLKAGVTDKDTFLEEAIVMKRLRHPKLIMLYAVCTDKEPMYIVTEYMANGCLQDLLKKDKGETILWHEILEFATQIAMGMSYIESQRYIHRDLSTRNILVDEYMLVKIGDFGLSKALLSENELIFKENIKLPVKWTAIEAITSNTFTIKSDVWSFGILLIELVTYGATPYPGLTNREVWQQLQGFYRHPKPPSCPDEMYHLMVTCWNKDPTRRPTFEHLYDTLDNFYIATQAQYKDLD